MEDAIKIHETAFVTATFRATHEELSKDKYSKYWRNPRTDEWIEKFTQNVSNFEAFTHSLRNRFFYETIKNLIVHKEIEVLINLGCGFSMYPFLFEKEIINIEIDQEEIIEYKKNKIEELIEDGKLPSRKIHYIAHDFNAQEKDLAIELKSIVKDKPSFVLLEGLIFFLSEKVTNELMDLISTVQIRGSYLGSVSYLKEIEETKCFQSLIDFFSKELSTNTKFEYLTLPTSYYKSLSSYDLIKQEDYISLSNKFCPIEAVENENLILNENMYILKKQ